MFDFISKEDLDKKIYRLCDLFNQGLIIETLAQTEKLLHTFPRSAALHVIAGDANTKLKRYETGIKNYKMALEIKPDFAVTHFNLGNALYEKGELEEALKSYVEAIRLKPDYAVSYLNMGNVLKEKGELEAAIKNYSEAIRLKPDYAQAHRNICFSLEEQGNLEEALLAYKRALKVCTNDLDVFLRYEIILAQLYETKQLFKEINSECIESLNTQLLENPSHQNIQSIYHFLHGDYASSEKYLNSHKELFVSVKTLDTVIKYVGYHDFLRHLIDKMPLPNPTSKDKIYHIGDSHCLSYAHHRLKVSQQVFSISPVHTIGAKAFHFSTEKMNNFKSITKRNLNSIPINSLVFISFGEIDCRRDEGLIRASLKNEIRLKALVKRTVRGYVKWFLEENNANRHRYNFFNVPAPVYNKKLTWKDNLQVSKVIKLFNRRLKKELQEHSLGLIDIYLPTVAGNGFSNNLYHCDNWHLDSRIIPFIQKQINC